MATLHKLPANALRIAQPGKHCDGAGLWLVKYDHGGGKWVLRYTIYGRRREMGLGSLSDVSLKQARERSARWRALIAEGKDPIKERNAIARFALRADTSLRTIAEATFEARKAELKGDGKAGRWFSPLELHVLPKLGKTPIEEIDQRDVRDVLMPIWHNKADTARKAMNRLGIVLRHAAAMGLAVDLQATEKAKALLGKSRHEPKHIPAMAWQEVPGFYASIQEPTITHLALRLLILTGARSMSVRFLQLDQIDGDIWTVPQEYMKGIKGRTSSFRIPLSREALRVVELAKPFQRGGFLFPSARKDVISDATMSRLMERREMKERPHGFRSSLRDWLAEATDASHELAETVLAHTVGTAVTRAYQRSDLLEQRRGLLERWADHVTGKAGSLTMSRCG